MPLVGMSATPSISTQHRGDIEVLRVFGAFAIVWYHAGVVGHEPAYVGLVMFLVLSAFLAARVQPSRSRFTYRLQRMLLPWVIWFLVYGLINLVKGKPFLLMDRGMIVGLLAGPSIHLWYVPFVFFCLMLLDAVRSVSNSAILSISCGAGAILMLCFTSEWRSASLLWGYPWAQYAHGLPAILLGTCLGGLVTIATKLTFAILLLVMIAALAQLDYPGVGLPYALGALVALGLVHKAIEFAPSKWLATLSDATYGIYFVHIAILAGLRYIGMPIDLVMPIAAFAISIALVVLTRHWAPALAKYWS